MKDKTLHLVEDLLAGGLAVLMGIYLCACWAEAAPPEPTKGELVEAYYGEGLRVPGSGRGVEAPPPKGREKDRKAIWSEDQTDISFGGDDVVVNEPFASAVEKLTGLFWCDLSWAEGDSSPRSE